MTVSRTILLSALAFSVSAGISVAHDASLSIEDNDEAVEWHTVDEKDADPLATLSYFHEGNGCSQDWWQHTNGRNARVRPNDEARSMDLRGSSGTIATVFDSPRAATTDDFAIIQKTDNRAVCVSTFENSSPGKWVRHRGYLIWYSGGNGLDGKVSYAKWGKWW